MARQDQFFLYEDRVVVKDNTGHEGRPWEWSLMYCAPGSRNQNFSEFCTEHPVMVYGGNQRETYEHATEVLGVMVSPLRHLGHFENLIEARKDEKCRRNHCEDGTRAVSDEVKEGG